MTQATITRRTFTASLAAAFGSVVAGKIAPAAPRGIDLTPFTDPEAVRWDLSTPFDLAGHTYATDGRVLVRVPAVPGSGDASRKVPPVDCLPWEQFAAVRWRDYPRQQWTHSDKVETACADCGGLGRVGPNAAWCAACDELGYSEDTGETCDRCCGTGRVGDVCATCGGSGEWELYQPVEDLAVALVPHVVNGYAVETAIALRGQGFQGLLMPMDVHL